MAFASVNGIDLYYESHGDGPAVVFAHGVGGNHASWYQQVPFFSRSYQAITVDQRGFGSDDEQVGLDAFRRRGHGPGDPRVARGDHDLGRAPEHMREHVLPPPAPDDADLHVVLRGEAAKGRQRARRERGARASVA